MSMIPSMGISSTDQLEDLLSQPTEAAMAALERVDGDITLLGVAGKMGPTLARMARRAADVSGQSRRVIGVSRFSQPETAKRLQRLGYRDPSGRLAGSRIRRFAAGHAQRDLHDGHEVWRDWPGKPDLGHERTLAFPGLRTTTGIAASSLFPPAMSMDWCPWMDPGRANPTRSIPWGNTR